MASSMAADRRTGDGGSAAVTWQGTVAPGFLGTDAAILPAGAGGAPALALLEGRNDTDEPSRVGVFTDLATPLGGTFTLDDADYILQDPVARVQASPQGLASGDFDGDGRSDLVVGDGYRASTVDACDVTIRFGPPVP